jgi:hypothetical protein
MTIFFLPYVGKSQYVSEILEYQPAPGQLINTQNFGSPQAAQSIVGNINGLVSLGAFGGSITLKMEAPIQNDPNNPFGVDFTIFGNAFPNWSEPGAVKVMKDENGNGLADDTWYLIAGSDYYFENTGLEFQITYFNPNNENNDILWVDQNQDSGFVFINNLHQHAYYPSAEHFPNINQNSQTYTGLKISGLIETQISGNISSYHRGFGFADNLPIGSAPYNTPDNPYSAEIENSGGDAIDISWAVDQSGQYVFLDEIHFIKIITAINNHAGPLGEISTEIAGIIDVVPNSQITGATKCIVIQDIPRNLLVNSETNMKAFLFEMGIPSANQNIEWSTSSDNIAYISNGKIVANQIGDFILTATSLDFPWVSSNIALSVIQPESLEIAQINQYLLPNEEIEIKIHVADIQGNELTDMDIELEASNDKIEIFYSSGKKYIRALELGESWLLARVSNFPNIKDSILIRISNEIELTKVFVGIKTENLTIFPRQSVAVSLMNIEDYLEPSSHPFQSNNEYPKNLAQVIVSTFRKMNLENEFRFKNDLENGALYLWKVPVELESSLEYVYGYGGRTESPFERSWIVKLNDQNIVRDFQNIPIQNHDQITIYHVNNVNENWTLKEFRSLSDSVEPNFENTAELEAFEVQMYANAQMLILNQWPVSNKAVYDNGNELWHNNNQVFTNIVGIAQFQLNQLGDHIISAAGEEIKIHVSQATGSEELSDPQIGVYPNPVSGDYLNIFLDEDKIEKIYIINLTGQIVYKYYSSTNRISVSNLNSGIYFLHVHAAESVYIQRFIRR